MRPDCVYNLKNLTNNELENNLKTKSTEERKLTLEIIELLEEMDRRKLYLERGYGSLIEYCIQALKYSESSAYRRISAMRVVRDVPETKESLKTGSLNLVTVAQAQTFFRAEAKVNKHYSKHEKKLVLSKLEHKSTREAEKVLLRISPESIPQEKVRQVTEDKTQVTLVLSENLMEKLNKLKNLVSHKKPNCNYIELLEILTDMALKKLDPEAKTTQKQLTCPSSQNLRSAATAAGVEQKQTQTRYIPIEIRKQVWMKSKGQCCYKDPKTGNVCGSKRFLEIDHIRAYSRGGLNSLDNLQLLCSSHNLWKGTRRMLFSNQ